MTNLGRLALAVVLAIAVTLWIGSFGLPLWAYITLEILAVSLITGFVALPPADSGRGPRRVEVPVNSGSGIGEWLRRAHSDAGAVNLRSFKRLIGLAFALSLVGFVIEWIGDVISSPPLVQLGQWAWFAGVALVAGSAIWVGARLVLRGR